MAEQCYMCVDLKRYFASAECAARGLDPFKTNLVVADESRGKGALCLAVTPALSKLGVKNRCRLYEIPDNIDFIIAKPRMRMYMNISAHIYGIYKKFVAAEDVYPYSIDEVFLNAGPYLSLYKMTPKEFANAIMDKIMEETGITATAGIGTNMFLAKVALDITAKHVPDHIGLLDEQTFRETLWKHQPITDIWGIGSGTAKRLARFGVYDLEGITHIPEQSLYRTFGKNAEILIDHAYGREPCTLADVQNYQTKTRSLSNSQVLFKDYSHSGTRLILKEMVDSLTNELVGQAMYTDHVSLYIRYSNDVIAPTGGSKKLEQHTNSYKDISEIMLKIYDSTTNKGYSIRQIGISYGNLVYEHCEQLSFFKDDVKVQKEQQLLHAVSVLKDRFGKNSVLRGMSLQEDATAMIRNTLVGGHSGG
ncbi:DNA repair protein [uncultured Ruminococcus sp.]|uniref:Y-family DNA polymerase n=1 Tax=uncultured Ruminococcus sp. TaxID=165186 RepID=UPI0025FA0769|nr:DNA repair protein [uncultured Ruminococcus sp.]